MPVEKGEDKKMGISVSIEKELLKELDDFCRENYNAERSAVVEESIRKFLNEKKRLENVKKS